MLFFDSFTGVETLRASAKCNPPLRDAFSLADLITHAMHRIVRAVERLFGL